eukprot:335999_1
MQKMEYVKVFKEHEAKHLVKQIVAGLCYFHQYNIVHRDLKLDNLMFNNNVLKIIDFGLAGDCTDKPLNTPCGTIHFTAPEVLSSYDYTIAADMWSLGMYLLPSDRLQTENENQSDFLSHFWFETFLNRFLVSVTKPYYINY